MTRYTRELRFRFKGDATLAQRYIPQARVVVGKMLDNYSLGVTTGAMSRTIAPGVVVRASVWDGMPIAEIDVTRAEVDSQAVPTEFNPWVPEGFVFYPASDASPNGWGLPLQQVEVDDVPADEQVFALENLAAGLNTDRWTPGGALGEVLLTRKQNAGYPDRSTDTKQVVTYPALYHPEYGPHPDKKPPREYAAWQAYRLEFVDFDANVDALTVNERAERKTWKRTCFRLFNEHRESIGREPVNPPLRGDYDSAQATCEWAVSTGWFGHSCAGFPPTWRAVDERGMKNGTQAPHYAPANEATMGAGGSNVPMGSPISEISTYTGNVGDVQYTDQYGFSVRIVDGFSEHGPQTAFDMWLDSAPHRATIEHAIFDGGPLWGSWVQIGHTGGMSSAHFTFRQQWIQCGNRYWHSAHDEVPTLSWMGPTSKNLYDDTWPVAFAPEFNPPNMAAPGESTARVRIAGYTHPFIPPDDTGATATRFYQRLHETGDATYPALNQGVFGPYIFARGRTIAIAPDAGFVLAAAMYRHGDYDVKYRLMALCLHGDDDPGDVWQGFTPTVRLWWVDLPSHVVETFAGVPTAWIAGNPHTVVREKYGAEATEWPWVESNSPYSWRGGEAIDVSSSGLGRPDGDLLSYASLWEFNREGTKAICLRYSYDKAAFDWAPTEAVRTAEHPQGPTEYGDQMTWLWDGLSNQSIQTPSVSGLSYYKSGIFGFNDCGYISGTPVFCELTLDFTATATTASLATWTHNPAGGFVPNEMRGEYAGLAALDDTHWYTCECPVGNAFALGFTTRDIGGAVFWKRAARVAPLYAFYSDAGDVRAVYDVVTNMSSTFKEHYDWDSFSGHSQLKYEFRLGLGVFYRGVSTGPSVVDDAQCMELVATATQYSSEIGCNGINTVADWPIILHASDRHVAFAALGVDCPLVVSANAPVGFPFNLQPRGVVIEWPGPINPQPADGIEVLVNPNWAPGDVVATDRHVVQMDVYLDGARIHSSRHPNPNKFHLHRSWNFAWTSGPAWAQSIPVSPGATWGRSTPTQLSFYDFGFEHGNAGFVRLMFAPRRNTAWGFNGGFVEDRSGNWAVCAEYGVQLGTAFFRTNDNFSHTDTNGTQYGFIYPGMAVLNNVDGPYNTGGFMAASFAPQERLAEIMNIPGDNPRSHYVRLV